MLSNLNRDILDDSIGPEVPAKPQKNNPFRVKKVLTSKQIPQYSEKSVKDMSPLLTKKGKLLKSPKTNALDATYNSHLISKNKQYSATSLD